MCGLLGGEKWAAYSEATFGSGRVDSSDRSMSTADRWWPRWSAELTLQQGGGEKVIKAGESWTEKTGDVHAVVNRSTGITRVVVSLLLPKGAAATTLVK